MSILELSNVRYTYQTRYRKEEALKGISHGFETSERAAVRI